MTSKKKNSINGTSLIVARHLAVRIIHRSIFIKVSFQQIRIWVGRSKVQISALARLFSNPISIKIYPSSYDLNTGYQFMWDMTFLTVHLLSCEECNLRSIIKRSTWVVANLKRVLSFASSSRLLLNEDSMSTFSRLFIIFLKRFLLTFRPWSCFQGRFGVMSCTTPMKKATF